MAITSMDYKSDYNVGTGYGKQGTRQAVISSKSEFSNWIRQFGDKNNPRYRPLLDTWVNNYRIYDVDYVVWNKTNNDSGAGQYMFIEEKVKDARMRHDQALLYYKLDKALQYDPEFLGFHFLRLENTTPGNGLVFLDEKVVTREELLLFIEFQMPMTMYDSWFKKLADDGIEWKYRIQT